MFLEGHTLWKYCFCGFDFSFGLKQKFQLDVLLTCITWNNQKSFVKHGIYIRITSDMYIISVHSVVKNWNSFLDINQYFKKHFKL